VITWWFSFESKSRNRYLTTLPDPVMPTSRLYIRHPEIRGCIKYLLSATRYSCRLFVVPSKNAQDIVFSLTNSHLRAQLLPFGKLEFYIVATAKAPTAADYDV
jgi:hypothetical protein